MVSYALQKEKHLSKRDDVLKAINDGRHRFTELYEATGMSKKTLVKVLNELMNDFLINKQGEGQKIRYHLTTQAREIFKVSDNLSIFRDISEAYQKWHPSSTSQHDGLNFVIGTEAFFPVAKSGTIYTARTDEQNRPKDRFVADAALTEGIIQRNAMRAVLGVARGNYWKGDTTKHGRQYIAVVIDYDRLQERMDLADDFENSITQGNGMTLFFSGILNLDTSDDPIMEEWEKTGLANNSALIKGLDVRQKNALRIVIEVLPITLQQVFMPRMSTEQGQSEMNALMKAVRKSIDGPFLDLVGLYQKEYGDFLGQYSDYLEKRNADVSVIPIKHASAYFKTKGILPNSAYMNELTGILLLTSFLNENLPLAMNTLAIWGAPFMFSNE